MPGIPDYYIIADGAVGPPGPAGPSGGGGLSLDSLRETPVYEYEFWNHMSQSGFDIDDALPWRFNQFGSGNQGELRPAGATFANHPGVMRGFTQAVGHGAGLFLGYQFFGGPARLQLVGGEQTDLIFRTASINADPLARLRFGFSDVINAATPVYGVYVEVDEVTGNVVGTCMENSTPSNTATIATLSSLTWYRLRVALNDAYTVATFTVFSEAGAVLGTATLNTNLPTSAVAQGFVFWRADEIDYYGPQDTMWFDWTALAFTKAMVR